MFASGRHLLIVICCCTLVILLIDRTLIIENFQVQNGNGDDLSIYSVSVLQIRVDEKDSSTSTTAISSAAMTLSNFSVKPTSATNFYGPPCSNIFDPDPFRDFRSELEWIPNRTLVPWAQLNRKPPCILEPEGVDPFNVRRQRQHTKQVSEIFLET